MYQQVALFAIRQDSPSNTSNFRSSGHIRTKIVYLKGKSQRYIQYKAFFSGYRILYFGYRIIVDESWTESKSIKRNTSIDVITG